MAIFGAVSVLLVNVSVVSLPTNVSVLVGNVSVPVLLILEITGAVNVLFDSVFVVLAKYVSNVSTLVCLIVPESFVINPSLPENAVVPTDVSPSTIFNSVAVAVIAEPPICNVVAFTVPVTVSVEPSKVKFASPSNSVVVAPIVTNLFSAWLFNDVIVPPPVFVVHDKTPLPSVFNTWFAVPSSTGNVNV